MYKLLVPFFICYIHFSINTAYGQAKNALGLGPAINVSKTGSYNRESGIGARLQGEIKLANRISLVPSIGLETPYNGYLGISGKYYPIPRFHLLFGGIAYIGGDVYAGVGPSVAIGYQLVGSRRNFIDIDLHGEIIKVDPYENTTVLGLRLTYNFSFSRPK
ncbi:hypothetical protein LPB86_15040 [Pedobacter sp. MC2016-14]|uniref:hypothetical protein n=1 Tax=Pedobacter sp. MC2016-14 TaxID=2897327 RepID=UPI001E5D41D6|nr:hypothetical protein [Pedobacter sp. MC2016-14]MCD0489555.1 hypothetical protein [Pedobacter sp. MC2016-14]